MCSTLQVGVAVVVAVTVSEDVVVLETDPVNDGVIVVVGGPLSVAEIELVVDVVAEAVAELEGVADDVGLTVPVGELVEVGDGVAVAVSDGDVCQRPRLRCSTSPTAWVTRCQRLMRRNCPSQMLWE